jgi:hypothetical protein
VLARHSEPVALTDGMHAQAIVGLIHWGLMRRYGRQSRARLVILHKECYRSVGAQNVPGKFTDAAWIEESINLRLQYELTHLATKRLLEEMRLTCSMS